MFKLLKPALFVTTLTLCHTAMADISCRVVGVSDGDTFTCLQSGNKQLKVRMNSIDAPEKAQAFGTASRQALSNFIFAKDVVLKNTSQDRYGRTLAEVYQGGVNINQKMVEQGMAWAYREYLKDQSYITLENAAKSAKKGLWADPNPIYPQAFRRGGKSAQKTTPASPSTNRTQKSATSAVFGNRCTNVVRTCSAATTCQQAKEALACGVKSLDRDGDGIPCEKLCR